MQIKISTRYDYMPQTMKHHVKAAYIYCKEHGIAECNVNRMTISFDFANKTGRVTQKAFGYLEQSNFTFEEV